MSLKKSGFLFALILSACAAPPQASIPRPIHSPAVLDQVADLVRTAQIQGEKPVVAFDLDDTLFDVRPRTLRVLQAFAASPACTQASSEDCRRLSRGQLEQMRYDVGDTMQQLSISDKRFREQVKAWWKTHFFSSEYCEADAVIEGAAEYLERLHSLGARIVYLSGRDVPRMGTGTLSSLKKNRFPLPSGKLLILKPNAELDDLKFKKDAFRQIADQGTVIAVFENEPKNLNAMAEAFPRSVLVFLDTQHSQSPDLVTEEAHWVKDYRPTP